VKNTPLFSPTTLDQQSLSSILTNRKEILDKCRKQLQLNLNKVNLLKNLDQFPAIDLLMGLEIELEEVPFFPGAREALFSGTYDLDFPSSYFFICKDDGSLRPKEEGAEFISRIGLTGQEILLGTKNLLISSDVLKDYPSISPRTSVHVHINVLPYTFGQLKKIVFWYSLLEPLFFKLSGNRDKNIFCIPWYETAMRFYSFMNANDINVVLSALQGQQKYSALNLLTVTHAGTIEFRHHQGTFDYSTIENWMLFLYQFITSAIDKDNETLQQTFEKVQKALEENNLDSLLWLEFEISVSEMDDLKEHIKDVLLFFVDQHELRSNADLVDNYPAKPRTKKTARSNPYVQYDDFNSLADMILTTAPTQETF